MSAPVLIARIAGDILGHLLTRETESWPNGCSTLRVHSPDQRDITAAVKAAKDIVAEAERVDGTREEWRKCSLHPTVDPRYMWGCPDCVASLRTDLGRLKADYVASLEIFRGRTETAEAAAHALRAELEKCKSAIQMSQAQTLAAQAAAFDLLAEVEKLQQSAREGR